MNNEGVKPAGDLCLLQQLLKLFSGSLEFTLLLFVLVLHPALHKLIKHLCTHRHIHRNTQTQTHIWHSDSKMV